MPVKASIPKARERTWKRNIIEINKIGTAEVPEFVYEETSPAIQKYYENDEERSFFGVKRKKEADTNDAT